MDITKTSQPPILQPDIPGYVHGIICTDPPTVQCDGCGYTHSGATWAQAVLFDKILFNPHSADPRRLCKECRDAAGWDE